MQDQEIELKFGVIGKIEDLAQAMSGIGEVSDCTVEDLKNTYFDTPDEFLFKRGAGLRIRRSNTYTEQTLKMREENLGGLHRRAEFNLKVDEAQEKPDLSLFDPEIFAEDIDPKELTSKLVPVCSINFKRTSLTLKYKSCLFEVCYDQGEIAAQDKEESYQINELEVELKEGDIQGTKLLWVFFSLANEMSEHQLPLTNEPFSKMHKAAIVLRGQRNFVELPEIMPADLHSYLLSCLKGYETLLGLYLVKKNPTLLGYIARSLENLRTGCKLLEQIYEANDAISDTEAFKEYKKVNKIQKAHFKSLAKYFKAACEELTFSMLSGENPDYEAAKERVRETLRTSHDFMVPITFRVLLSHLDEALRANLRV